MPIHDDEESEPEDDADSRDQDVQVIDGVDREDEEDPPSVSAESSNSFPSDVYNDMSPRVSASSKSVLVESETSPETVASYQVSPVVTAFPSSAIKVEGSVSQQSFPQRLSVASRIGERSPLSVDFAELDNYTGADSPKRAETGTPSTWEKVKNSLVRAGSSSGRRSRTNSIVTRERRDNTDSSVSRESGGSLTIGKIEPAPSSQLQAPSLMQTPSASASILSLTPAPPRMSASPIPPASDMSRYQNSKLIPFPGIVKLEEERRRNQLPTASSLDVPHYNDELHPPPMTPSWSSGSSQTADPGERQLSYPNSEVTTCERIQPSLLALNTSFQEYIDISPSLQQNGSISGMKLPMTLPGVKLWLKNSKKKTPSQPDKQRIVFRPCQFQSLLTRPWRPNDLHFQTFSQNGPTNLLVTGRIRLWLQI
jgi:serine/arginine repetitive matrix protein 2